MGSFGQRPGEPEDAQRAGVGEAGHGADLAAREGEHEYPVREGDGELRLADIEAESGLAVGPGPSWTSALLIAGAGVSMALPTVPTAVLNAVASRELGKAAGINYMMQRFGAVFAIAVASAVFATYGHLGTPAACAGFALLAALSALAITPPRPRGLRGPAPHGKPGAVSSSSGSSASGSRSSSVIPWSS